MVILSRFSGHRNVFGKDGGIFGSDREFSRSFWMSLSICSIKSTCKKTRTGEVDRWVNKWNWAIGDGCWLKAFLTCSQGPWAAYGCSSVQRAPTMLGVTKVMATSPRTAVEMNQITHNYTFSFEDKTRSIDIFFEPDLNVKCLPCRSRPLNAKRRRVPASKLNFRWTPEENTSHINLKRIELNHCSIWQFSTDRSPKICLRVIILPSHPQLSFRHNFRCPYARNT